MFVEMSKADGFPGLDTRQLPFGAHDTSGQRSEFERHGRQDLVDPLADVDRQLLDEVLARTWAGVPPRFSPRRRGVLLAAGILATMIAAGWLARPTHVVAPPGPALLQEANGQGS